MGFIELLQCPAGKPNQPEESCYWCTDFYFTTHLEWMGNRVRPTRRRNPAIRRTSIFWAGIGSRSRSGIPLHGIGSRRIRHLPGCNPVGRHKPSVRECTYCRCCNGIRWAGIHLRELHTSHSWSISVCVEVFDRKLGVFPRKTSRKRNRGWQTKEQKYRIRIQFERDFLFDHFIYDNGLCQYSYLSRPN